MNDFRLALRSLRRRPVLFAVTIATLAVGIAANGVMFGVVDQLLLQPAPGLHNASQLRRVFYAFGGRVGRGNTTTFPIIAALVRNVPGFETAAYGGINQYTLGAGANARPVQVQLVSSNFFSVVGARAAAGRWFLPDEGGVPVGKPVAVISWGFWRRELGASPDALGRVLQLNDRSYTVVGIAQTGFTGVDRAAVDVWLPISAVADQTMGPHWYDRPYSWWVQAIVRIKPGVTDETAQTQATTAVRAEMAAWNSPGNDQQAVVVLGSIIRARYPSGLSAEGKVSLWLQGVSLLVLLIACANVANLLIVRTIERRRELAVRLALGIGRVRLLRMLLTEAAVLAAAAGVAAVLLTLAASRAVQQLLLPTVAWESVVNLRMLVATLAAVTVSIALAGLTPAITGLATSLAENLKAGSQQAGDGGGQLRHTLLALQAALSVVLLIGAGLFTRSLRNVASREVGIEFDHAILVTLPFASGSIQRPQLDAIYAEAQSRIAALPGVAAVSLVRESVPARSGSALSIKTPGMTKRPTLAGGGPYYSIVSSNYFATIGTRLERGRSFSEGEDLAESRSFIINRVLADAFWPGQDPLGQCAYLGSDSTCSTVVGVAENAMLFSLIRDDRALLYIPPRHPSFGNRAPSALIVRSTGGPGPLVPAIHQVVQALAPNMPYAVVSPYANEVAGQLQPWRLGAAMFTAFGLLALLITSVGLFSVIAHAVSQRSREIGVRMALGAEPWGVVRLVTLESAYATLAGLAVGVGVALLASPWVAPMLYQTSPREPSIFLGAVAALILAGVAASIVPARRSSAVDPASSLRAD